MKRKLTLIVIFLFLFSCNDRDNSNIKISGYYYFIYIDGTPSVARLDRHNKSDFLGVTSECIVAVFKFKNVFILAEADNGSYYLIDQSSDKVNTFLNKKDLIIHLFKIKIDLSKFSRVISYDPTGIKFNRVKTFSS